MFRSSRSGLWMTNVKIQMIKCLNDFAKNPPQVGLSSAVRKGRLLSVRTTGKSRVEWGARTPKAPFPIHYFAWCGAFWFFMSTRSGFAFWPLIFTLIDRRSRFSGILHVQFLIIKCLMTLVEGYQTGWIWHLSFGIWNLDYVSKASREASILVPAQRCFPC